MQISIFEPFLFIHFSDSSRTAEKLLPLSVLSSIAKIKWIWVAAIHVWEKLFSCLVALHRPNFLVLHVVVCQIKQPFLPSHTQWIQPTSCYVSDIVLLVCWETRTRTVIKRSKWSLISNRKKTDTVALMEKFDMQTSKYFSQDGDLFQKAAVLWLHVTDFKKWLWTLLALQIFRSSDIQIAV